MELKYLRVLSRGLFRSRRAVYLNSGNFLDPNALSNYQKYSEEDRAKVLELVDVHGQNWKLIGQLLGRSDIKHLLLLRYKKHVLIDILIAFFEFALFYLHQSHHDTV